MGIRTPGLVIANDALYQLSYTPETFGRQRSRFGSHFKTAKCRRTNAAEKGPGR